MHEIAFGRRRRPDRIGLVALPDMQRAGVGVRIDRDGAKPEPRGGARDPAGDLAAVGNQDGREHEPTELAPQGRIVLAAWRSARGVRVRLRPLRGGLGRRDLRRRRRRRRQSAGGCGGARGRRRLPPRAGSTGAASPPDASARRARRLGRRRAGSAFMMLTGGIEFADGKSNLPARALVRRRRPTPSALRPRWLPAAASAAAPRQQRRCRCRSCHASACAPSAASKAWAFMLATTREGSRSNRNSAQSAHVASPRRQDMGDKAVTVGLEPTPQPL